MNIRTKVISVSDIRDDADATEIDGSPASPAARFGALQTFDVGSVEILSLDVTGFALAAVGKEPTDARLGEPCGTPACPYGLVELSLVETVGHLADRMLRDVPLRWSIDMREYLRGMRRDVFSVSAKKPLVMADLRGHPILWRVPLSPEALRRTGHRDAASASVEWELVRVLRDALPAIDGILLPPVSGRGGQDLLLFEDRRNDLTCQYIGAIQDTIPTTADSPLASALQRLLDRRKPD